MTVTLPTTPHDEGIPLDDADWVEGGMPRQSYASPWTVASVKHAAIVQRQSRLDSRKRIERKNGLEYTDRRIVLPNDADIPRGRRAQLPIEENVPVTADVLEYPGTGIGSDVERGQPNPRHSGRSKCLIPVTCLPYAQS